MSETADITSNWDVFPTRLHQVQIRVQIDNPISALAEEGSLLSLAKAQLKGVCYQGYYIVEVVRIIQRSEAVLDPVASDLGDIIAHSTATYPAIVCLLLEVVVLEASSGAIVGGVILTNEAGNEMTGRVHNNRHTMQGAVRGPRARMEVPEGVIVSDADMMPSSVVLGDTGITDKAVGMVKVVYTDCKPWKPGSLQTYVPGV
jgi:hypothetical protein